MKKFFLILFLSFSLNANLSAILPPLYQGIKEVTAILRDPQLGQLLSAGDVLLSIEKNDRGYLVTTNHHELQANVIYTHEAKIGPQQFTIVFDSPTKVKEIPNQFNRS